MEISKKLEEIAKEFNAIILEDGCFDFETLAEMDNFLKWLHTGYNILRWQESRQQYMDELREWSEDEDKKEE